MTHDEQMRPPVKKMKSHINSVLEKYQQMADDELRVGNFKRMKMPRTLKKKLSKKKLSI